MLAHVHSTGSVSSPGRLSQQASSPALSALKPLDSTNGAVFERKHSEGDKTIIDRVQELASRKSVTMAQIALAWMGQR
ncbi:hypothetical protein JVT61DRAFT_12622 [Boletus reticuloceps]|uniref:NADP-dependent oxidoreductase domain-containing protein n=1 Tax=Boletus reticuloceps TaxID=495285 RepID=A0A8I2YDN9_9AGAM|nr:hypothetical protein JVT61DRAFT_12622 [Boletus reticuloceps]